MLISLPVGEVMNHQQSTGGVGSCMTILPDVEPEDGVQLEPQFVPPHVRDTVVPFLGPNDRSRAQTSAQTPRAMIDVSNITMMMYFVCCHKELVFLSTLDRQDVRDCYKTKVHHHTLPKKHLRIQTEQVFEGQRLPATSVLRDLAQKLQRQP